MKLNNFTVLAIFITLVAGCGGGGSGNSSNNNNNSNITSAALTATNSGISGVATDTVSFQIGNFNSLINSSNSVFNNVGGPSLNSSFDWGLPFFLGQKVFVGMGSSAYTAHVSNDGVVPVGDNVIPITVNGSLCSPQTSFNYLNKPCVSVTVCTPGTNTCQTITDILLDTGSYGLRIFKSAISVPLQQLPVSATDSRNLADCVSFQLGAPLWGSVQMASVILGNEPAIQIPIQVIDSTFGATTIPTICQGASATPQAANFTGILGVGTGAVDPGPYYACNGTNCTQTATTNRIPNPAVRLPADNNGVIVQLASVSSAGAASANGSLIFGIGTRSNNILPASTVKLPTDQAGDFFSNINGTSYESFLDTGSNGLFFDPPAASASLFPTCSSTSSWYCP